MGWSGCRFHNRRGGWFVCLRVFPEFETFQRERDALAFLAVVVFLDSCGCSAPFFSTRMVVSQAASNAP